MTKETVDAAERIRKCLDYNPDTGEFTWISPRRKIRVGDRAGGVKPNGYVYIGVDLERFSAHRVAWMFITGEWPKGNVDHIDGNPSNNRADNLRDCSQNQNMWNSKKPITNKSGFKGVSWSRCMGKWQASIRIDRKSRYLGCYDTPEEAHEAYKKASAANFGEYARHR